VLIIDDEADLAATFALCLDDYGYRALTAIDAAMGWEMAHTYLPDLILCDIEMPGKDGRHLLQEMRADPVLADRQFVLMTGKPAFGNARAAMDLGADDFLLKPVPHALLLSCVTARLRRAQLSHRMNDGVVAQLREGLGSSLPQKFFVPLANILGITQVLDSELESADKKDIRRDLHSIQAAAHRLRRTVRNYLLIADLEGPKKTGPGALLDAEMIRAAVAKGVAAAAEPHHRSAQLSFEFAGAKVRAYSTDISSLAEELVDNAMSYSRSGTDVKVRAWADGAMLRFSVTDAGRGMTDQQLEYLRSPAQYDGPLLEQPGTGLGLMLVRKVASRLGGSLDLESEAGRGTTSRVSLPTVPGA
jgi:signal transduction histidine kinase